MQQFDSYYKKSYSREYNTAILTDVLNYLKDQEYTYEEWIAVGMVLKDNKFDVGVWDQFSQADKKGRYHTGECSEKWTTFENSTEKRANVGTIVNIAKNYGWERSVGNDERINKTDSTDTAADVSDSTLKENNTDGYKPNIPGKYKGYINGLQSAADVPEAMEYLAKKGLTEKTVRRLLIKYDPAVYFPGTRTEKPALIYPYSRSCDYYIARDFSSHADRDFKKPSIKEAGSEPIYNKSALLKGPAHPCWICEGATDVASIMQCGGSAAAIIKTGKSSRLIDELKAIKGNPNASPIIICFDIDDNEEGQKGTEELAKALDNEGIWYYIADFDLSQYPDASEKMEYGDGSIDPNDLLVLNPAQFAADVAGITKDCLAMWNEYQEDHRPKSDIEQFLEIIQTETYKPVLTGVNSLDALTHGGLIPQTLTLISAEPGTGKTTLCGTIFEYMARHGTTDCIYLNLEMSREQMLARSIARKIYLDTDGKTNLTVTDILQLYRADAYAKQTVIDTARLYETETGNRLKYNPAELNGTTDLDKIMDYLENAATEAEKAGKVAPAVCMDYLQILTKGDAHDDADVLKKSVQALKKYAIKHKAIVIGIMAQSRKVNDSGVITQGAGRDTSALEYTADLLIQMKRTGDNNQVRLYITKSRFSESNMRKFAQFEMCGRSAYLNDQGTYIEDDDDDSNCLEFDSEISDDGDRSTGHSHTGRSRKKKGSGTRGKKQNQGQQTDQKDDLPADKGDLPKNLEDLPEMDFTWDD